MFDARITQLEKTVKFLKNQICCSGVVGNALNGLSLNDDDQAVLGQDVAEVGSPAALTSSREIPLSGFNVQFLGSTTRNIIENGDFRVINLAGTAFGRLDAGGLTLQGDEDAGFQSFINLTDSSDTDRFFTINRYGTSTRNETWFTWGNQDSETCCFNMRFYDDGHVGLFTQNDHTQKFAIAGDVFVGEFQGTFFVEISDFGNITISGHSINLHPAMLTFEDQFDTSEASINLIQGVLNITTEAINYDAALLTTAPATVAAGTVTNRYGGATNFLGDPAAWELVSFGGTSYKRPLYNP